MSKNVKIIASAILSILLILAARPFGTYMYYLLNPKPKPWGVDYTNTVHKYLDSTLKQTVQNDKQREQVVGCIIEKYKQDLPNGLSSISHDSLYNLSVKYGKECSSKVKNIETTFKWTEESESTIRKAFLSKLTDNRLSEKIKDQLCDCIIEKLKERYPNGVSLPFPVGLVDSMSLKCIDKIKKSN